MHLYEFPSAELLTGNFESLEKLFVHGWEEDEKVDEQYAESVAIILKKSPPLKEIELVQIGGGE